MKTQYKSVIELAQAVEDARAQKRDMIADSRQLVVQDDAGRERSGRVANG